MSVRLDHLTRAIGHSRPVYGENGVMSPAWRRASAEHLRDSFFQACQALNTGMLIECGAHAAETSMHFVGLTGGHAIAIEANPHTYQAKTARARTRGVDTRNVGLGSRPGVADFHIPHPESSKVPGNASFLRRVDESDCETISVSVTTLDEIFSEIGDSERIALWVDVEGLAREVLSGGPELLSSSACRVIMVEVETQAAWLDQSLTDGVDSLLAGFGFTPLMRDAEYEHQYNVVYVSEESASLVDEVVVAFWSGLATLQLPKKRRTVRTATSQAKSMLVARPDSRLTVAVHRVSAALGSTSSRDHLTDDRGLGD